jgi:hypothetical protein
MWGQTLENILTDLKVQHLVVPAMRPLLSFWTNKMGFQSVTLKECAALDERIVSPDLSSVKILKKQLHRY